ncbi:hypothetical protein [Haloferula sp.]|uniref:hypothetical protein n=1 Tax=Haloferula sp. TaxID=2497595 RepID=UPI003C765A80
MSRKQGSQWAVNKGMAEAVLRDRGHRRSVLGTFAFGMLGMLALGLWGIEEWLKESILRFGLYWGACGLLCLFVLLFALFDVLVTIKEEREREP